MTETKDLLKEARATTRDTIKRSDIEDLIEFIRGPLERPAMDEGPYRQAFRLRGLWALEELLKRHKDEDEKPKE